MTAPSVSLATRRPQKAIVAVAGSAASGEQHGQALLASLSELGVETIYIGRSSTRR